jgi:hypothetical protein
MDDMRRLFVMRGCQQLELPLKKEMDEYNLFCKVEEIDGEPHIVRDQPMSDGVFYAAIKSISFIMGLLCVFFYHQFRFGTGKILDKTGKTFSLEYSISSCFLTWMFRMDQRLRA